MAMDRSALKGADPTLRTVVTGLMINFDESTDMEKLGTCLTYLMQIKGAMTWSFIVYMLTTGFYDAAGKCSSFLEKTCLYNVHRMLEERIIEHCILE